MKRLILIPLAVILLCCTPFFLFSEGKAEPLQTPTAVTQAPTVQKATPFDTETTLRVLTASGVREMTLRDYLIGTLLAEMPADFPPEALRAQAIASRTFALRKAETGKHIGADVCTDYACCQGWDEDGTAEEIEQITQAVCDTDGLVVTYGGTLIDATFFSCSGGKTEAALAVWGSDIPYLQSVDSPGEEDAPRYTDTVIFNAGEFAEHIHDLCPESNLSGSPVNWFGEISRTVGGGIDTVFIGGTAIKGTALRTALSLRSTDMDFAVTESEITVTTCGFGHRVGLSQYGAKVMAEGGSDFAEILTHYYPGTEIKKLLCIKQSSFTSV